MAGEHYLAVDLGAESGRGVLAAYDGSALTLTELGRFATSRGPDDIGPDGVRRWDFERIWREVRSIVDQAEAAGPGLAGVAVDTWGVDFGMVDAAGALLEQPAHYREATNVEAMEECLASLTREAVWDTTGIQFLPFNTLYQLVALRRRSPEALERAAHLLMMPDLLHFRLTGEMQGNEYTDASTSQILSPVSKTWDTDLLARLGLPSHFLGPIVMPGALLGSTPAGTPVYAPGGHDTASAVAAAPAQGGDWAFLSSGTWSLLGVERDEPLLSRAAMRAGMSNEGGTDGRTLLLKNIMGLWLVQECRRSIREAGGPDRSYEAWTAIAEAVTGEDGPLVDATDQRFIAPEDMPSAIRAACITHGQTAPSTDAKLMRCCLDSLAFAYRRELRTLEALTGSRFQTLHVLGGGSRNAHLNQWTADACGIPVLAGPAEATAIGNVLAQMVGSGAVAGWEEAREVSRRSFPVQIFEPDATAHVWWTEREAAWVNRTAPQI